MGNGSVGRAISRRKRTVERKRKGLCVKCGKEKSVPERVICETCRLSQKKWYLKNKG